MGMGLSPIYLNKGTDSRLGLTKKDSDLLEIVHLSFDFISFSLCIHTRGVARGGSGVPVTPPLVGLLLSKQPTIFRWRKRHDNILAVKAIVEKPTFFKNLFFWKVFWSTALVFS